VDREDGKNRWLRKKEREAFKQASKWRGEEKKQAAA